MKNFYSVLLFFALMAYFTTGVIFSVLMPPFQVPDEPAHWGGGYLRLERVLKKKEIPELCGPASSLASHFQTSDIAYSKTAPLPKLLFRTLDQVSSSCGAVHLSYGNLLTYPNLLLSRAIIDNEGESARNSMETFYLARILSGCLVFLVLLRGIYFSYRSTDDIPFGLLTLIFSLSAPLLLQQSFSINADLIINLAVITALVYLIFFKHLKLFDFIFLIGVTSVAIITKPPIIPIVIGLVFLFCLRRLIEFKSSFVRSFLPLVLVLVAGGSMAIIAALADHTPPTHQILGKEISVYRQFLFSTKHPWKVLGVIFKSFEENISFAGLVNGLGWFSFFVSERTMYFWRNHLIFVLVFDISLAVFSFLRLSFLRKLSFSFIPYGLFLSFAGVLASALTAIAISFAMYMLWSSVGSGKVEGLQPRYFHSAALGVIGSYCLLLIGFNGVKALDSEQVVDGTEATKTISSRMFYSIKFALFLAVFCVLFTSYCRFLSSFSLDILYRYW